MQDVLIISPRFAPVNAADMHRIRLSLGYYRRHGWNPIVLTVALEAGDSVEPALSDALPADIEVIRVKAWAEATCRLFGFGQIDYRSFAPLLRAGSGLIAKRQIKLVFFSTTVFLSFLLGPIWKRRFGVRLVYDIQDPWFHGDPLPYTAANAPGSWRKYRLSQKIAGLTEPMVARAADHFICVSDGYVRMLSSRYHLPGKRFTVLPFPAAREDYDYATSRNITQKVFAPDGRRHWVYAGRGGPDMNFALSAVFFALAQWRREDPALGSKVRLHFVGTNYAPSQRTFKVVEPLAEHYGVGDLVSEHSTRAPYYEVLALYRAADQVLVVGSDSSDYTASKLLNCVLSGRPVLAVVHQDSLVTSLGSELDGVELATFQSGDSIEALAGRIVVLMRQSLQSEIPPQNDAQVAPWLAETSTARQCAVFDQVMAQ